jgi:site-specific recombinase XerD
MGWLKEKPRPAPAYVEQLRAWAAFLRTEEGLAEKTCADYCWWADGFLRWLKGQEVPLRRVTVAEVDGYLSHLSVRGLSRITLAIAAKTLQHFFRDAYAQKWCRQDLAHVILAPRLFQQENVPAGLEHNSTPLSPVLRTKAPVSGSSNHRPKAGSCKALKV